MIPAFLVIFATLSTAFVVEGRASGIITNPEPDDDAIRNQQMEELDFGYESDFDFQRDFWNLSGPDSEEEEEEDDDEIDDNNDNSVSVIASINATSTQQPSTNPLHRRNSNPKRASIKLKNLWIYKEHNDACGIHIVQKYYSRAIFSYRVFGPHSWNYQEIVRGPRSERRSFPVIIPLPMLPAKLNLTVTTDREEIMYPFANVYYEYGSDVWKSSDSRCRVGKYDRSLADLNWNERRIDCSFACL